MKYVKLFVGFLAAGIAFILAGFYIRTLPVNAFDPNFCYQCGLTPNTPNLHLTFDVGTLVIGIGVALLIVALVIGLYGYFSDRKNAKMAKIEPNPAQVNP
ncbi:MAG TPA: hypothetical protein VNE86_02190 [Nitrososphaerales archaeon]|nr:hypothetical protein [Nitrososphaerales archaeon]